jgi:hypothetical protein
MISFARETDDGKPSIADAAISQILGAEGHIRAPLGLEPTQGFKRMT